MNFAYLGYFRISITESSQAWLPRLCLTGADNYVTPTSKEYPSKLPSLYSLSSQQTLIMANLECPGYSDTPHDESTAASIISLVVAKTLLRVLFILNLQSQVRLPGYHAFERKTASGARKRLRNHSSRLLWVEIKVVARWTRKCMHSTTIAKKKRETPAGDNGFAHFPLILLQTDTKRNHSYWNINFQARSCLHALSSRANMPS